MEEEDVEEAVEAETDELVRSWPLEAGVLPLPSLEEPSAAYVALSEGGGVLWTSVCVMRRRWSMKLVGREARSGSGDRVVRERVDEEEAEDIEEMEDERRPSSRPLLGAPRDAAVAAAMLASRYVWYWLWW